ncbi:hypothetical protein COCNU_01G011140 [Cocos nucifera]|uniref:DM2 domain-containing protein n=1 Tax=Cocos nucifera TaxID=13894 RepID=A0A8K0HV87_COCNU|nr:hypothetical protein COCNU_01G011130 [Cocos nucifera]KAG1327180.1 hypothetical protein COCNU_01G011140 [Cocos nucifera]
MVVARKAVGECPKKVASLIDLANLPSTLREFAGQSQMSHLSFFIRVWSHIKANNLQCEAYDWVPEFLHDPNSGIILGSVPYDR